MASQSLVRLLRYCYDFYAAASLVLPTVGVSANDRAVGVEGLVLLGSRSRCSGLHLAPSPASALAKGPATGRPEHGTRELGGKGALPLGHLSGPGLINAEG